MDTEVEVGPSEEPEPIKTEGNEEAANNPAASSDSESDTDSDSDDEAQDNMQLQTLESELTSNPSNYDAHVQYIALLRKLGEIEKLRQARESMSCLFPLSPSMWREWAKDETSLISGPQAVQQIEQLYERAVFDYLSIPLWCDYLSFILEYDPAVQEFSSSGISKARNLFERALTTAGLHLAEGSRIWEVYRNFELAIFKNISESDREAQEKQVHRIRKIFHRQLSIPLSDMSSTLKDYKAWEVDQGNDLDVTSNNLDDISSHVASAYQRAQEMCNARADLEAQISKPDLPDIEKVALFMKYLKFEESSGDPARVQILYERAVTDFPVSSDLWLNYCCYLDRTIKVGNIVKDVYARATRSCPWVGELWVKYLLCLERSRAPEEEISKVFDKALLCTFSNYDEYLDLFLTRVDGLRRRILVADEIQVLDYSLIRGTFQSAVDYLQTPLKGTEAMIHLHAYWARLELSLGKDIAAARGVWESLLRISGSMLEAWKGYIAMEIENGNINEARGIYRRCYAKRFPASGSEDICHSWLRFEREFGTLEGYDHAVQKVSPRLRELQLFKEQEAKSTAASVGWTENPSKQIPREKRKATSNLPDDQSPAKRQKDMVQRSKKGGNWDVNAAGKNLAEESTMELTEVKAEKKFGTDKKYTLERPKYTDQCTAFISNLSLQANYEHVRKFFDDVGGVLSIRILKDKFTGKSRGLAYVDFSDHSHLAAAIAKNRQTLLGKKLSIARSDPKQNKRQGSGGKSQAADAGQKTSSGSASSLEKRVADTGPADQASGAIHESSNTKLKGKNTFAVPRNVRALGWSASKPKVQEGEEQPKSNDEFRKMLLKR